MNQATPQFASLLHQPLRLAIAVHLAQHGASTLADVRAALSVDDLAPDVHASPQLTRAHAALLHRAGVIEARTERGKAILRLTENGREALAAHRAALLAFIPNSMEVDAQ